VRTWWIVLYLQNYCQGTCGIECTVSVKIGRTLSLKNGEELSQFAYLWCLFLGLHWLSYSTVYEFGEQNGTDHNGNHHNECPRNTDTVTTWILLKACKIASQLCTPVCVCVCELWMTSGALHLFTRNALTAVRVGMSYLFLISTHYGCLNMFFSRIIWVPWSHGVAWLPAQLAVECVQVRGISPGHCRSLIHSCGMSWAVSFTVLFHIKYVAWSWNIRTEEQVYIRMYLHLWIWLEDQWYDQLQQLTWFSTWRCEWLSKGFRPMFNW
jgi:hypothetical protein